jgi:hypothetical protein
MGENPEEAAEKARTKALASVKDDVHRELFELFSG